mmetsp:Transcript_74638/g.209459  ORF Transcript_74638/g.209459 Transcript_74638/m.209459 type:complete len:450 (-) Transcript_74638:172-1521(-)
MALRQEVAVDDDAHRGQERAERACECGRRREAHPHERNERGAGGHHERRAHEGLLWQRRVAAATRPTDRQRRHDGEAREANASAGGLRSVVGPNDEHTGADDGVGGEHPYVQEAHQALHRDAQRQRHADRADEDLRDQGRSEARGDIAEDVEHEAVAGHGKVDSRLRVEPRDHRGEDAQDRAPTHEGADPRHVAVLRAEGCGHGRRGADLPEGHHTAEDDGEGDVEEGAEEQRAHDGHGQVPLRVHALLGGAGDGAEACVGVGAQGSRRGHRCHAEGHERVQVLVAHVPRPHHDDEQHDRDLQPHEKAIRLTKPVLHTHAQHHSKGEENHHREDQRARGPWRQCGELQHAPHVLGAREGGKGGADVEVEEQVEPGEDAEELPEGGVGVEVGAARHRDPCGDLCVAQRAEDAPHSRDDEGEADSGAGGVHSVAKCDEDACPHACADAHER